MGHEKSELPRELERLLREVRVSVPEDIVRDRNNFNVLIGGNVRAGSIDGAESSVEKREGDEFDSEDSSVEDEGCFESMCGRSGGR